MFKCCFIFCIYFFYISNVTGVSLRVTRETRFCDCEDCDCVPMYKCGANNIITTDGADIIDVRIGFKRCTGYDVCCKIPKEFITSTLSTIFNPFITEEPKTDDSKCGIKTSRTRNLDHSKLNIRIAGNPQNRDVAHFGEFPWMAGLFMPSGEIDLFMCGASVIQSNVLLTAAHCVHEVRANHIKIRAGDWDLISERETPRHQEKFISRIIIHPDFDNQSMANDIALLILTSPLTFTSKVAPICLPEIGTMINTVGCIVTGWGSDSFENDGRYQHILKKAELQYIQHQECQDKLRGSRLGADFELHENFVCAGGEEHIDACQGDGGGPLICPVYQSDRYVQMGIISWGIGCKNGLPGIYTNVFNLIPWIKKEIANIS